MSWDTLLSFGLGVIVGVEVVLVDKTMNRKADAIAKWIDKHTPGDPQ